MAIGTPATLGTATGNTLLTTLAMTVTASAAVGDWVIVATGCFGSATHTVTDSAGNTWATHVTSNGRTAIHSSKLTNAMTSGVSTITVTWNPGQTARTIGACKVTGLAAASHFDVSATANGSTAAWNSGTTASTTQADELVIGACSCDTAAAATSTPGGSYTEVFDVTNTGGFQLTMTYLIVAATGTQSATGTWTSSGWAWNAAAATFKGDGGGGAPAVVEQLAALGVG